MTVQSAIQRLSDLLGPRLDTSAAARNQHAQNEAHFAEAMPDAVAMVETTAEVSQVLRICNEEGCPVAAHGAGSSLEGQHLPVQGGISLDMMAMDKVLSINAEDMDAVVQPGVTREALNDALRATGLFFSVDPGANASLGGMASTRASGTTALRYGTMRDNIRALEVVLADGSVIRTGTRARKSASGYDLTGVFVGAEGTLGIITELTVKLHGTPEAISAAVCAFPTVEAAVNTVVATIQMGIPMARMELLDAHYIEAINARHDLGLPLTPHLFLEFHGSENGVREQAETVGGIAAEFGGSGFDWKTRTEDRNRLWKARHSAYEAMNGMHPGRKALVTDICVPISQLSAMIEAARADIEASSLSGGILGHVGDGNFHAQLMMREGDETDKAAAKDLAKRMALRALKVGGTITGEHGVGLGKKNLMADEHGPAWAVMGGMKRFFDPNGILNPGKTVPG